MELELVPGVLELSCLRIVVLQLNRVPHDVDSQGLGSKLTSYTVQSSGFHLNAQNAMLAHLGPNFIFSWVIESLH